MAELQSVLRALKNAHSAGDTAAAQKLAQAAKSMGYGRPSSDDLLADYEPTYGVGEDIWAGLKGIPGGALDTLETAAVGASAALPDKHEPAVRDGLESMFDTLGIPFEVEPGLADRVPAKLGRAVGSTVPFLATAAMGPVGVGAAVGLGTAAGAGEARIRAEQAGATPEEIQKATALGMIPGVTEVLAPVRILTRTLGRGDTLRIRDRLTRALAAGGEEGLQEAATQVAQNMIAQKIYDPEQGAFADTGESFGYGAGVGGLLQGLMDLAVPGRRRAAAPAPVQETPEPVDEGLGTVKPVVTEAAPSAQDIVEQEQEQGPSTPTMEDSLDAALEETPNVQPEVYVRQRTQDKVPRPITGLDEASADMQDRTTRRQAVDTLETEFEEDRNVRAIRAMDGEADQADMFPREQRIAEAAPLPVVDENSLLGLGVAKNAAVVKAIRGKDLNDPAQRDEVLKALIKYSRNPVVRQNNPSARRGVMQLITELEAAPAPEPVTAAPDQLELDTTPAAEPVAAPVAPEPEPEVEDTPLPDPASLPEVPAAVLASMEGRQRKKDAADQALMERAAQVAVTSQPSGTPAPAPAPAQPRTDDERAISNLLGEPTTFESDARVQREQERDLRAAVAREIERANPVELGAAMEQFMGNPVGNPTAAIKSLRLPEQVMVLNALREAKGLPIMELPGMAPLNSQGQTRRSNNSANNRLREKIEQGAKPLEILEHIANDVGVSRPLRALARALKRVSSKVNYTVSFADLGVDTDGNFRPLFADGDTSLSTAITLNDTHEHDYAQAFLHEHIHALTFYAIGARTAAGRQITQMYQTYKKAMGDADHYGLTNDIEFVAEALTNPVFQRAMRRYAPNGQKLSMWERFVDIIKGMLGMRGPQPTLERLLVLTSDAGVAVDEDMPAFLQQKIEEYMNGITGVESVEKARSALQAQGQVYNKVAQPVSAPTFQRAVRQVWESGKDLGRRAVSYALPMPSLNDLVRLEYGTKYPAFADAFADLTRTFAAAEGDTAQFIESIDPISERISQFVKKFADRVEAFNELYFSGTTSKVDLTKLRSAYAGDPAKQAEYDRLKAGPWRDIGSEGQALYRMMRAIHNRQFTQLVDTIRSRVYASTRDAALANDVANKFQQRLTSGHLEGYGALVRTQGKYLLRYFTNLSPEPGFERFENIADRDARAAQLTTEPDVVQGTITSFTHTDKDVFENVAPNSFIGELLTTLQGSNVPQSLKDAVMEMAISVSPSNAILDRIAKRKETPGYIRDAFFAFRTASIGMGNRINNMKNSAEVTAGLRKLQEATTISGAPPELATLFNEAKGRVEYAANPALADWSNRLKAATYVWTLGANVSSAVVDMSSLALVTGPYLASQYGLVKASGMMWRAMGTVLSRGTNADIETMVTKGLTGTDLAAALNTMGITGRDFENMRTIPSLMNIDFADPNLDPKLKQYEALVNAMRSSGHSQRFAPLAEMIEQGAGSIVSRVTAYSGFLMNTSERLKREVGITAHYNLEIDKLTQGQGNPTAQQMEQAAQVALEASLLYNGGSTNLMGARFQQQDLPSVMFMYKRFAMSMLYAQYRMFRTALSGADPAMRAAALRQLGLTFASAALFAGVRGMPLMGPLEQLWNLLADEEEGDDDFETMLRKILGNGLTEGLPNALFNMNVGPRIELTNLMMRDANLPANATLADKIGAHLGGPTYGSINRIYRGLGYMQEGRLDRGVESLLPAALSNAFKTLRFATEGPQTLRGDPVTDVTFGGGLAQFLGFAPADYARAMEFTNTQRGLDRSLAARRTKLYERLYMAHRLRDAQGFQEALLDMNEFNSKHTERPEILFTPDKIRQSLTTRERNTQSMIRGALPSTARRGEWESRVDDWGLE